MTEHELDILRLVAGRETKMQWRWGAAMSECIEYLKSGGYVKLIAGKYEPTDKGIEYLDTCEQTD